MNIAYPLTCCLVLELNLGRAVIHVVESERRLYRSFRKWCSYNSIDSGGGGGETINLLRYKLALL